MLIFPISEPVDRRADDPGLHWTLGVLHCRQREAVYYDSFPVSSGFDIFRKVSYIAMLQTYLLTSV
jgi:hypothetical protein